MEKKAPRMTLPTGSRPATLSPGFTLLEVLVTVVILVGGVISLLRGYTVALAAMEAASETLRADSAAREALAEIELQAQGPQGLASGQVLPRQQAAGGFQESVGVSRLDGGTAAEALYEVTLELVGRRRQSYTWVTWLRGRAAP